MSHLKKELHKEIKEEITDEVKDIIYEKAKKEVKDKVKEKYYSIKDRLLRFFGFGETQEQKIRRISNEIKSKNDPLLSDTLLGTTELFSINYALCFFELLGFDTAAFQNEHKKEQ